MYNDELTERTIRIVDLFLDPNNPRFWGLGSRRVFSDKRTMDDKVQSRVEQTIRGHGVTELQHSILRNGFLPLDRIVVRPISGSNGKYVVVEGNRRLAALRFLRQQISEGLVVEEELSEDYLNRLVDQTDNVSVLVYNGSASNDISWILQGIRHIGGIRSWDAAQRAKLVVDQVDNIKASFTEAGQKFGLSARAVGRLYRCYKALDQMHQDDEFGKAARNDYFTLFQEAYRNASVREWLGWNDISYRYEKIENLRTFYSWITPDEEDSENRRRIHNQPHVKFFGNLISSDHRHLISKVDRHEMTIDAAERLAEEAEPGETWREKLQGALDVISSLPVAELTKAPQDYREMLTLMTEEIKKFIRMIDASVSDDDEHA